MVLESRTIAKPHKTGEKKMYKLQLHSLLKTHRKLVTCKNSGIITLHPIVYSLRSCRKYEHVSGFELKPGKSDGSD